MFINKAIKFSDLELLTKIFVSKFSNIIIFDPFGQVEYDIQPTYSETGKSVLINFGFGVKQIKDLMPEDFEFIIDFGTIETEKFNFSESLKLFKTKTNELKWITPKNNYHSSFLSFYNTRSTRAFINKRLLKIIGFLRMDGLIAERFQIYSNESLHFKKQLNGLCFDNYSIFCGAPGKLRKPVILLTKKNEKVAYSKLAISEESLTQITKERKSLNRLKNLAFKHIRYPSLLNANEKLTLTTTPLEKSKTDVSIQSQIENGIIDLFHADLRHQKIGFTNTIREVKNEIFWLRSKAKSTDANFLKKLVKIADSIDENEYIHTSIAHGDFTPWNMNFSDKMNLLDWEMANSERPAFYDLFHYVISEEVFVKRNTNASSILTKINEVFNSKRISDIVVKYKVNVDVHFHLYLLHKISQQMVLISSQEREIREHFLIKKAWLGLLDEVTIKINFKESRTTFLNRFQKFISSQNYAAIKFLYSNLSELPAGSDLDLIVSKKASRNIINYCKSNRLVQVVRITSKSNMKIVKVFFKNGEFLSIDLIHNISRKGLTFLSATDLLSATRFQNGIKTPSVYYDMFYIQGFYTLNSAKIPNCYQNFILKKFQSFSAQEGAMQMLNLKYGIETGKIEESFEYSQKKHRSILKNLPLLYENSPLSFLRNKLGYFKDILTAIFIKPGQTITFSGVDGAGKTTVINSITKELNSKYRKETVLLRHRPGILPILSTITHGSSEKAEKAASIRLPRQGKNKSTIGSILRFAYYFTDYVIGQAYVFFKYRIKGKIVVYDRYYFDFINDSKRSNIKLNRGLIKALYKFIHKPAYNFYLYNEASVILQRKKELSAQDIVQMNQDYQELFDQFGSKSSKSEYIQIKNDKLQDTVFQIMSELKNIA